MTNAAVDQVRGLHLLRQLLCPYCWERFPPERTLWISSHEDLRGDPVLGPDAYHRFEPTRFSPEGDALDARGMRCQKVACPNCHLEVPRAVFHHRMVMLSSIGVPGSGKSYFLTSMTWQLRQLLASKFSLQFHDVDTDLNRILGEYEELLFYNDQRAEPVAIEKTELEGHLYVEVDLRDQPVRLPRPFMFDLKPGRGHPMEDPSGRSGHVLCLYDNAGEHFLPGADTGTAPGTRHLANSRMLMFLYDPTKNPQFRERCRSVSEDPQIGPNAETRRQETVLNEAFRRIRQHTATPPGQRLQRPLAVLVAKSDIWSPLIDEDLTVEPLISSGDGDAATLDVKRVEAVSQRLRKLMMEVAPEFVTMAENETEPVVYIPVSALGCSPEMSPNQRLLMVRPDKIRPSWVTVPVLYALSKWSRGLVHLPEGA